MLIIKPAFRAGLVARFSIPGDLTPQSKSIWFHGSSAGEIDLLRPLLSKIEKRSPNERIVVSAFAISGYRAAKKLFPQHCVIYFPADFSPVIRRFLKVLRPGLIVLVESEFWPNFIATVSRQGIPLCVLNARMSQKSFRAHRRTFLIPWALRKISHFGVQTDEDASRIRDLGVPATRLTVTGNMKYDLQQLSDPGDRLSIRRALRERYAIDEDMPVFIGGSIHQGEDSALAWAFQRLVADGCRARMIIVPRYPAESAAIGRVLEQHGLVALRKSRLSCNERAVFGDEKNVLVIDTIGELRNYYAMSDIAYVGGSLTYRGSNKGGHNLMEPAIFGVAVMFGPYTYSFRDTVRDLQKNQAGLLVHDQDEIYSSLKGLLREPDVAAELGNKAHRVIMNNCGATDRNFALIEKYIPSA